MVVLGHRSFWGDSSVIGMSMIIGKITFSIVGGLGYVGGRSRGFVLKLQVLPGPFLLRRLRRLV